MIRQHARVRSTQIGPAEAAAWLSNSRVRQRHADGRAVARLADQIRSGRWCPSSTICVGRDGLLDGQHRMLAIVQAGAAVDLQLVAVSDPRMRCVACPECCHVGGQRSRAKPYRIALRRSQRRSRGRTW